MNRRTAGALLVVLTLASTPAIALPVYSDIYFFGASSLDTGNWLLDEDLKTFTSPTISYRDLAPVAEDGYWQGRWQSGPAWSDYLATALGHDATASLAGGQNYAYGVGWMGPLATEGTPPSTSPGSLEQLWFSTQIDKVLAKEGPLLDAAALYVVSVGGNDSSVFGRGTQGMERGALLASEIDRLQNAGANQFLVQLLGGADTYSLAFNAALIAGLDPLIAGGASISYLDMAAFNAEIFTPPFEELAELGFMTHPAGEACIASLGATANAQCTAAAIAHSLAGEPYLDSTHVSFDGTHLDTKILKLLADFALASLPPAPPTTVPEPGTLPMLIAGMFGLLILRRRRSA